MPQIQEAQQYKVDETLMQALATAMDMMIIASKNMQMVYGALQMTVQQQDVVAEQAKYEAMRKEILAQADAAMKGAKK